MSVPNPYSSPPALQEDATRSDELQILARMRPAVRLALVSGILFTIGTGISSAMGLLMLMRINGGSQMLFNPTPVMVARSIRLLILMIVLGYITHLVWRMTSAIHDTLRSGRQDLREVLQVQKSCWYAIGILGILFIVLNIAASAIMALLQNM